MNSEKIKDYLIFYPTERIIIFPIHEYLPVIISTIINDYDEWGLLDKKKITQKEKYFKFFLEKKIDKIIDSFIILFRDLNIKIYSVYKENIDNILHNEEYALDYTLFYKNVIKMFKKKTKYIKNNNFLFLNYKGFYKNIRVGICNGNDLEFFLKLKKY